MNLNFILKDFLVVIALMFITSCCESCSDTNVFVVKNKNDTAVVRIDIDEYYDFDGRGCADTFKVAIY